MVYNDANPIDTTEICQRNGERVKKKKGWKAILLGIVLGFFAVYLVVSLLDMQVKLSQREKELADVQQQVEVQEVENKELERRISTGMDDEKLERDAKEQLDYAGEDERVFIDMSGSELHLCIYKGHDKHNQGG